MIGLKRGTVKLVLHHKDWVILFENEKKSLKKLLDNNIRIEHVGSTAIPEVYAKPVIDIVIGCTEKDDINGVFEKVKSLGYEDMGEKGKPGRRFFAKGPDDNRTFYIHVVRINGDNWDEYILFRDFLLHNKKVRENYNKLKKELFKKYANNRKLYTGGKAKFITDIINKVKKL